MSPETLINFAYNNCSLEEISRHEAAFDEEHFRSEIDKTLKANIQISSFVVEVTKHAGQSTNEYRVLVGVKGPMIDLDIVEKGESAATTTLKAIHIATQQIRETKEKLKP